MPQKKFFAIGIMSGTSLDGLDLAYCGYPMKKKSWDYKFYKGETIPYDASWKAKLRDAHKLTGEDLMKLHADYGIWIGKKCKEFVKRNKIDKLDLVCSHGHTVFHQPLNGFTFQLGDGNAIHSMVNVPVVYDFRSLDVHLGGQGAPLVPIGDRYLFNDYDVCLNLGGIANLSREDKKKRVAFDICFANMGLNELVNSIGKDFDNNGLLASKGKIDQQLLMQLIELYKPFLKSQPSLAREQFESEFQPLLTNDKIILEDRLRTFTESIAYQIGEAIKGKGKIRRILLTGGGTKNKFLISLLKEKIDTRVKLVVPNDQLIDFKEAIVFGFLGLLRKLRKENVLSSVTNSKQDSVSGSMVG